MKSPAESKAGLALSALLLVVLAVGAFLLFRSEGVIFQRTSLDFGHLVPWISTGAILLALSRIAGLAQSSIERRTVAKEAEGEEEAQSEAQAEQDEGTEQSGSSEFPVEIPGDADGSPGDDEDRFSLPTRLSTWISIARCVLTAAGGAVLIAGVLTAVATLPSVFAAGPGAPDLETLSSYLQVFGALVKWIFVAAVFYAATRVAEVLWPAGAPALRFPWRQAPALALAYILLANGGVLSLAFEFPGTPLLIVIAVALILPYLSSVGRHLAATPLSRRLSNVVRTLLLISDIGWMALILGIMVSLPALVDGIPALQEGGWLESVAPYLEILNTLALWSVILLAPFIVIRLIAVVRPTVGVVFGFPMGRIILFALALVAFSKNGLPATASSVPIPNLVPAIGAALLVSYIALVLRRVGQLGLPDRHSPDPVEEPGKAPSTGLGWSVALTNIPPLIGAFMPALAASLVAWALLQSLPLISAPLMDAEATEAFGRNSLPYFAGLHDARLALTGLVFTATLFLSLPDPLWAPAQLRVRPMVTAVGFTASGCLAWLSLAPLSVAGHAFPLLGAITGAGFITLALSQLAAYAAPSSSTSPVVPAMSGIQKPPLPSIGNDREAEGMVWSDAAQWLASSRIRGFLIGASLAFYGLLLRPAMYETMWFAAAFEWIMVLAVAVWAMFKIRGNVKSIVETAEAAPSNWARWERHEQQFEERPDPRRNLVSRWHRGFVESGEWSGLWSYLMGLLCHNNATPDDVTDVFRPLRRAVESPGRRSFWRRGEDGEHRRRESGLAQCLRNAGKALSTGPIPSSTFPITNSPFPTADRFIETGDDPEAVAAEVISEYRRRGADTDQVVNLWFPLVNVVDQRPQGEGWFQFPWVRRRNRARDRERRRRLVEGASSHLSGEGSLASLPVGIAAQRVPLFGVALQAGQAAPSQATQPAPPDLPVPAPSSSAGGGSGLSRFARHQMMRASSQVPVGNVTAAPAAMAISAGQAFELLRETAESYYVRTSDNFTGYVSKPALRRLPILPGDEVSGV